MRDCMNRSMPAWFHRQRIMFDPTDIMITTAFILASLLACVALWTLVHAISEESRKQGYRAGYRNGTYDALKTDLSSKTAFPHK